MSLTFGAWVTVHRFRISIFALENSNRKWIQSQWLTEWFDCLLVNFHQQKPCLLAVSQFRLSLDTITELPFKLISKRVDGLSHKFGLQSPNLNQPQWGNQGHVELRYNYKPNTCNAKPPVHVLGYVSNKFRWDTSANVAWIVWLCDSNDDK